MPGHRWGGVHQVADELEQIRRLSWQKPDGFESLKLLSQPTVESLADEPGEAPQKVAALKSIIEQTICEIEEEEKLDWPELDRSDARAGRLLLRLDPDHERATVTEIHRLICTYWKKRGKNPGETVPLGEGFRKHLQRPLYERLASALLSQIGQMATMEQSPAGESEVPDLLTLWDELTQIVFSRRSGERALPQALVKVISALDTPLREALGGGGEAADMLTKGALRYARQLSDENRDSALISFRSNLSLTLHIIGEHGARVELGERALRSADILENSLARAEILVDDLGWGNYMNDRANPRTALANISAAERIAREALEGEPARQAELTMVVAKAIRHRTLIVAEQQKENRIKDLEQADKMLQDLDQTDVVRREIGQIFHARALVQAVCLGIDDEPVDDPQVTASAVSEALENAQKAAQIFRQLGDQARYTKALYLECRLHHAAGDKVEAEHVKALRDRALARSAWSRPERVSTLNQV